ncbi:hypothetical protein E3C22_13745 [Jiella endophytica]|uniref:Uncharacterized protein n=1 Tax=Jiella endophytica TaxID=2558362 RepID=A0A4Y8RH45_9HYPH|nr:hypothetical protein [Jiella endophytica]TFF21746.1 hypothetical protein E3C22_13745 [Jiella endophytica]
MTDRYSERLFTFQKPFTLGSVGKSFPAGTYRVLMDCEEIAGLSFSAYRRSFTIQFPTISKPSNKVQMFSVGAEELVAALTADGQEATGLL